MQVRFFTIIVEFRKWWFSEWCWGLVSFPLSSEMGGCVGRYSGDNETVSVSSASVSRPPTAGMYICHWCITPKRIQWFFHALFRLYPVRYSSWSGTQESSFVSWNNTLAFRCSSDRGPIAFETWWILGYSTSLWWAQRNLGCPTGSNDCSGSFRLPVGPGHTGWGQYFCAEWVSIWYRWLWPVLGRLNHLKVSKLYSVKRIICNSYEFGKRGCRLRYKNKIECLTLKALPIHFASLDRVMEGRRNGI